MNKSRVLQDFRRSKTYQSFLVKNGFQEQVYLELETDTRVVFYSIGLKKSGDLDIAYSLVVYNPEDVVLFSKKELEGGKVNIAAFAFPSLELYGELDFNSDSPSFGNSGSDAFLNCNEQTNTFSACMSCSLSTLLDFEDDWVGAAACTLAFEMCIAAAVIHCIHS